MRSLAEDRVERGVDLNRTMHCDSCDTEKEPLGSTVYGVYKLCNDCFLDFTLKLASGEADNVAEFMTKRDDGVPPSGLENHRDRSSLSVQPLSGRDKLMPHNEPC